MLFPQNEEKVRKQPEISIFSLFRVYPNASFLQNGYLLLFGIIPFYYISNHQLRKYHIMTNTPQETVKFEKELALLDKLYLDLVESIHQKPDPGANLEDLRLFVDNAYVTLNRSVAVVREVKATLEADRNLILQTWNPPA